MLSGSLMCHHMDLVVPQRRSHTLMPRPHTNSGTVDPRRSTDGIRRLRPRLHSSSSTLLRRLLASLFTRASCTNVSKVPTNNSNSNTTSRNMCSQVKTPMSRPVVVFRSRSRLQPRMLLLHPFHP